MSPQKKTHTLILSDFHLGSKVSNSNLVADLLNSYKFKKLILLGDIFEDLNFERLHKVDWELLSLISKISKKRKVIWVEGNHDQGLAKIFAGFTGSRVYKSYKWRYKNKKYLAIHGHQFDNFLVENALLSFLANQVYKFIQLLDFKDKRLSRFIKRKSKGWLRLSEKVAKRALLFAKLKGVDYVFCGHTHKALEERSGKIKYFNCGCWTDTPQSFITIDEDKIKINRN